jgi:hypothetical protein
MKKLILSILFIVTGATVNAQSFGNDAWTNGYFNNSGTYVNGYYHTQPNNTNWDNYSTKGNLNPYTNEYGTRARDYSNDSYNYGSGQNIYTGPRGGQYYINSNGNKTYVPKN